MQIVDTRCHYIAKFDYGAMQHLCQDKNGLLSIVMALNASSLFPKYINGIMITI